MHSQTRLTLYDAVIPSFLQYLGSAAHLIDVAEAFCSTAGIGEAECLQLCLYPNMHPFCYQVKSAAEHSFGAINAVRAGFAAPNLDIPPASFAGLREKIDAARRGLDAVTEAELEELSGRDVRFEFKATRLLFSTESFLLSYAQPNFYFHVTTAYDILRMKGAPIGKLDYLGHIPASPY